MSNTEAAAIISSHFSGDVSDLKASTLGLKVNSVRLMLTDLCTYSCGWCGVHAIKELLAGKLTLDEYHQRNIGANEGDLVRNYTEHKDQYLDLEDITFFVATMMLFFDTQDITLTGGDPFLRKDYPEIANRLQQIGAHVTGLTKGSPLHNVAIEKNIAKRAGETKRIIFSLDTLDAKEHANLNLPLIANDKAVTFLPKTLEAIKQAVIEGYQVEINTVLPKPANDEEKYALFDKLREILFFCDTNGVVGLKLIELDSNENLGNPYIEDLAAEFLASRYFPSNIAIDAQQKPNLKGKRKHQFAKLIGATSVDLSIHRCHCASTALHHEDGLLCTFNKGGDMYVNTTGEVIGCLKRPDDTARDLGTAIKSRDLQLLIRRVIDVNSEMQNQYCPVIK